MDFFCNGCGSHIAYQQAFCTQCGRKIDWQNIVTPPPYSVCGTCGATIPLNQTSCEKCDEEYLIRAVKIDLISTTPVDVLSLLLP